MGPGRERSCSGPLNARKLKAVRKLLDTDAKRGFSALELIIAIAIFVALATIAMPLLSAAPSALTTGAGQLTEDIGEMRADAVAERGHYAFRVTSGTGYAIFRMRRVAERWQVEDEPVRAAELPSGLTFAARTEGDPDADFELDSRGFLTPLDDAPLLRLHDGESGTGRTLSVLPHGQVALLD